MPDVLDGQSEIRELFSPIEKEKEKEKKKKKI
jgi:hypothetical protein